MTVVDAPLKHREAEPPWYSISGLSDVTYIDLLLVEGPPSPIAPMVRFPVLQRLYSRMASVFVVLVDDADRPDEMAMVKRWLEDYPDLTATTMVCEKGMAIIERVEKRK